MTEISTLNLIVATMPVVAITALGYFFRRRNWVNREVQMGMMRLVIWVFTPALVVDRVLGNPLLRDFSVVWKVLLAGFLSIAGGIALALFAAKFFGVSEPARKRVFGYCAGIYNYGYVALPICMSLCEANTVGMMLLFNAGVEVGIWTVGLSVVSGELKIGKFFKAFANPIFISMVLAQTLNFCGLDAMVPAWFSATAKSLGACMIPCGILLVGMSLPILLNGFKLCDEPRISLGAIVMRLGAIPAVMVAAAAFVPALPTELRYILVIQAATPPAMLPIVIVQYYNGDARLALRVVLVATAACVFTLPFWIKLGFRLLSLRGFGA